MGPSDIIGKSSCFPAYMSGISMFTYGVNVLKHCHDWNVL
jgi:hypothetical protein